MTTNVNEDDNVSVVRTVLGAVFLLLLVAFVLANLDEVKIDFLLFEIRTRMLVAMLISALLGGAAALLFSGQGVFGIGRKKKRS